jgi:hypothetical protein
VAFQELILSPACYLAKNFLDTLEQKEKSVISIEKIHNYLLILSCVVPYKSLSLMINYYKNINMAGSRKME